MFGKIADRFIDWYFRTLRWCIKGPSFKIVVRRCPVLALLVFAVALLLIPASIILSIGALFVDDSEFEDIEDEWADTVSAYDEFVETLGF